MAAELPEPASETRTRRALLLVFLLFYLACLPLWHATSRVHRAPMPELAPEAEKLVYDLPLRVRMVDLSGTASPAASSWGAAMATHLGELLHYDLAVSSLLRWRVQPASSVERHAQNLAAAQSGPPAQMDDALAALRAPEGALPGEWQLFVMLTHPATTAGAPVNSVWTMGRHRHAFTFLPHDSSAEQRQATMEQAAAMLSGMVQSQSCSSPPSATTTDGHASTATATEVGACASSRSLSQRLSFLLVNDEGTDSQTQGWRWDFPRMERRYLRRFLRLLAPFVHFTTDSSVVHYARLTDAHAVRKKRKATGTDGATLHEEGVGQLPKPLHSLLHTVPIAAGSPSADDASAPAAPFWSLPSSSLKDLVGSIGEWNNRSPLVSQSLEMIAYVPPRTQRPLVFSFPAEEAAEAGAAQQGGKRSDVHTTALFVPRYGGVLLLNELDSSTCARNDSAAASGSVSVSAQEGGPCDLPPVVERAMMQVFLDQIRQTLAFSQQVVGCRSCVLLPSPSSGVSEWELDLLARRLVSLNLAESQSMLHSLYRLLEAVPHMPVSADIAELVHRAMRAREEALERLASGRPGSAADWTAAGYASQECVRSAHAAFFHPELLPALYFPDEHLYAVYLPLFMPVSMPILAALAAWIQAARSKRNQRQV